MPGNDPIRIKHPMRKKAGKNLLAIMKHCGSRYSEGEICGKNSPSGADIGNFSLKWEDRVEGSIPQSRSGGGSRIRTHEGVTPLTVFKTAAFNHSAIPPRS